LEQWERQQLFQQGPLFRVEVQHAENELTETIAAYIK
jgi:hypothetical protein